MIDSLWLVDREIHIPMKAAVPSNQALSLWKFDSADRPTL